jgi:hypothetical protein
MPRGRGYRSQHDLLQINEKNVLEAWPVAKPLEGWTYERFIEHVAKYDGWEDDGRVAMEVFGNSTDIHMYLVDHAAQRVRYLDPCDYHALLPDYRRIPIGGTAR